MSSVVISERPFVQMDPAVVCNGAEYVVLWTDAWYTGAYYWVSAALVSAAGVVLDTGHCIGAQQMRSELAPDIAFDSASMRGFAVWYNFDPPFGVYGRLLDATGQPQDTIVNVAATLAGFNVNPAIVSAAGQYFVVWADVRPGADDLDICGRFVSAQGQPAGPPILIATGPENQLHPAVGYDGSSLLVVWQEGTAAVLGQRLSTSGILLGENFPVSDSTPYYRFDAALAAAPPHCLVVWSENRDVATDIVGNIDVPTAIQERPIDRPGPPGATVFGGDLMLPPGRGYRVYDVCGRDVTGRPVAPGIYFIALDGRIVRKAVRVW